MVLFRLPLVALVLCYPAEFVHGRSRRPSRDECRRDRDCSRGEVCSSTGRRGRKQCARPPTVYCGSYTCPDRYVLLHDCDDIECEDGVCDYTVCCEPVVYCDSYTCSDSYELLHDCEDVECEDGVCDDSQCCEHVPTTTCTDELLEVTLPDIPVMLQFGLLIDLSGSYSDDLRRIKALAPDLLDGLLFTEAGAERELRLALGTYVDIPEEPRVLVEWCDVVAHGLKGTTASGCFSQTDQSSRCDASYSCRAGRDRQSPYGSSGDYDYREEKDFGTCAVGDAVCAQSERDAWIAAVDGLNTLSGGDGPESQSIALMSAIEDWDWTTGYTKFLAITTDAGFHTPDEDARYFSVDDIIAAANAKDIKIIALKAGSAGTEMDELADGTGGSVQNTTTTSSDIVDAIISGVEESTYSIVEVTSSCESPWAVTSGSPVTDVSGGSTVEITSEVCALDDTESTCVAEMIADGATLETFTFAVVDGMVVIT